MKKKHKNKSHIFQILTALILSFVCAFGCIGCVGFIGDYEYSAGTGNGGGSEKDPEDGAGGDADESQNPYKGSEFSDANDVFCGAVVEYRADDDADVFYDEWTYLDMSFNDLSDRQFKTMATYLYNSLMKIYGTQDSSALFQLPGFSKKSGIDDYFERVVYYKDILNDDQQKTISNIQTFQEYPVANNYQLDYGNTILGGYDLIIDVSDVDVDALGNPMVYWAYDKTKTGSAGAWNWAYCFVEEESEAISDLSDGLRQVWINQKKLKSEYNPSNPSAVDTWHVKLTESPFDSGWFNNDNWEQQTDVTVDYNDSVGISIQYMWNVAFWLMDVVIGSDLVENSILANDYVYDSSGNIKKIEYGNHSKEIELAFETCKGYEIIIPQLVENMFKLAMPEDPLDYDNFEYLSDGDLWDPRSKWDRSIFPSLKNVYYEYYDTLEDIGIGGGGQSFVNEFGEDDYYFETGYSEDPKNYDAKPVQAKSIRHIYLIPYITKEKIDGDKVVSGYTKDYFYWGGLILGMQRAHGDDGTNGGKCPNANPEYSVWCKPYIKYAKFSAEDDNEQYHSGEIEDLDSIIYGFFSMDTQEEIYGKTLYGFEVDPAAPPNSSTDMSYKNDLFSMSSDMQDVYFPMDITNHIWGNAFSQYGSLYNTSVDAKVALENSFTSNGMMPEDYTIHYFHDAKPRYLDVKRLKVCNMMFGYNKEFGGADTSELCIVNNIIKIGFKFTNESWPKDNGGSKEMKYYNGIHTLWFMVY